MGLYHSPRIVTDGLVFHADANNIKSYPGSGNTIYDLSSQNNNGTATTITTVESAPGTVIDYNSSTAITATFSPFINKYTWSVSYMMRGTGLPSSNYRVIFRLNNEDGGGSGYVFYADTREVTGPYILHYQRDYHLSSWDTQSVVSQANYLQGSPAGPSNWFHIDLVYRTSGVGSPQPSEWESWVNGQSVGVRTSTKNISPFGDIDELVLNASGSNAVELQSFKFYNRSLSEAEVKQNYNAMRGRLGL